MMVRKYCACRYYYRSFSHLSVITFSQATIGSRKKVANKTILFRSLFAIFDKQMMREAYNVKTSQCSNLEK